MRKKGGGRKLKEVENPALVKTFDQVIEKHTAGSPVSGQRWTYLTRAEIILLLKKEGFRVSGKVVKRLLKKAGLGKRTLLKDLIMKEVEGRNDQFLQIEQYKRYYLSRGYAVLSIDTKKKEFLGRFHRSGSLYAQEAVKCYDHDFSSFATGKIVPYGIYDLGRNEGYVTIGQSADTAEFAVSCLRNYWETHGSKNYKPDKPILILADGGGSNGSRNRLFKQELQRWANDENLNIRICHYPPYCSKYNPIEHRLFPAITRALRGVMLDSVETVIELIEQRTKLSKNKLRVFVDRIDRQFEKGIKVCKEYLDNCKIIFNQILGKWNYRVLSILHKSDSYL